MKRVTYISTTARRLSDDEIDEIARKADANNARDGVTGVLLSAHGFFFQVLEGEAADVDRVMERIRRDPRHHDVLILKSERDLAARAVGQWSMRTVRLEGTGDLLIDAIRTMLETITESHRIIERYTQPAVLSLLTQGINPLTVPARKTEALVLFADIVGFSHFSIRHPVEEVTAVVNLFLDASSRAIVAHGGEVTKFVGDCVVAYFPAERADGAVRAALAILGAVRGLRHEGGPDGLQRRLYCGIGLNKGPVIEGNIGSSTKLDYTVIGDTVNLASRLQGLTREVGRALVVSDAVRSACEATWTFAPAGTYRLKGQPEAQPVFTVASELVEDFPRPEQASAPDPVDFAPIG
jgi:class 3 adenylate cyclase